VLHPKLTIGTLLSRSLLAAFVSLVACSPAARSTRPAEAWTAPFPAASEPSAASAPAQPLPSRIYAFKGETLVITVGSPTAIRTPVRTESGESLDTTLWLATRGRPSDAANEWLPSTGDWSATEYSLGEPSDALGLWFVRVELPGNYANRPLMMGDRRLPVLWVITPPRSTDSRFVPRLEASASAWRELGDVLSPLRNDPANRWRVRLLTDRVRADRLWGSGRTNAQPIPDAVLEDLAHQTELRYRAAIARIQLADPRAAADLLATLTCIVAMPDGQLLPAWTDITPQLSMIVDLALNSTRPPARAAETTRNWIRAISPDRKSVV